MKTRRREHSRYDPLLTERLRHDYWRSDMTDDLTPDDILAAEAKADPTPAEVLPDAADLPDEVHTGEIVDEAPDEPTIEKEEA